MNGYDFTPSDHISSGSGGGGARLQQRAAALLPTAAANHRSGGGGGGGGLSLGSSGSRGSSGRGSMMVSLQTFARVAAVLRAQWFMVAVVAVILFAYIAPGIGMKGGPLHPEITVKYIAVSLIFLSSGITLRTEDLKAAISNVQLHILIQGFSMGAIPAIMALLTSLLAFTSINPLLIRGLLVVGCMPPPVSSAVILTKAAGANEAAAIFNSALGSFLGTVVTPALLLTLAHVATQSPIGTIFRTLSLTVIIPLLVGQGLRQLFWASHIKNMRIPFSVVSSCTLLLVIFCTFCDSFTDDHHVAPGDLVLVLLIIVSCQLLFLAAVAVLCMTLGMPPRDCVCAAFCASHKSLTLGIPMLKIVFAGQASMSLVSIPLLVYHPVQILLGSMLVPLARRWVAADREEASNADIDK
eukprot:m.112787 g.112787  ORF g.112787 m.112787 type:complete len:411 (+) comp15987_c2_seq2:3376-4608(+)